MFLIVLFSLEDPVVLRESFFFLSDAMRHDVNSFMDISRCILLIFHVPRTILYQYFLFDVPGSRPLLSLFLYLEHYLVHMCSGSPSKNNQMKSQSFFFFFFFTKSVVVSFVAMDGDDFG